MKEFPPSFFWIYVLTESSDSYMKCLVDRNTLAAMSQSRRISLSLRFKYLFIFFLSGNILFFRTKCTEQKYSLLCCSCLPFWSHFLFVLCNKSMLFSWWCQCDIKWVAIKMKLDNCKGPTYKYLFCCKSQEMTEEERKQ